MDEIDRANSMTDIYLDIALKTRERGPKIEPTGKCLYCEAPLPDGRRWCDADCRDDWQAENPI